MNLDEINEIDRVAAGAYSVAEDTTSASEVAETKDEEKPVDEKPEDELAQTSEEDTSQEEGDQEGEAGNAGDHTSSNDSDFFKTLSVSLGEEYGSEEGVEKLKLDLQEKLNLEKEIESLKLEQETIFANKRVQTLNDLYKKGKTDDQINDYLSLSKLGDISELPAKEALIRAEIQKNGYTRDFAEKVINRKYNHDSIVIDEDSMDDTELAKAREDKAFAEERMEYDAKKARQELSDVVKDLTTDVSPEEKALLEESAKKAYEAKLKPFAERIQKKFPSKIEIEGLSFDVTDEFRQKIDKDAMDYFFDTEVNETSVETFMSVKKAEFFMNNMEQISKALVNHGKQIGTAEKEQEFINTGGVDRYGSDPNSQDATLTESDILAAQLRAAEL